MKSINMTKLNIVSFGLGQIMIQSLLLKRKHFGIRKVNNSENYFPS